MNITIDGGFLARPAAEADFPALAETFNAYAGAAGINRVSVSVLLRPLMISDFDINNDSKVIMSPDGRIAGFALLENTLIPPVFPTIRGCVHPDFENRGIGSYLLDWAQERAESFNERVPEGIRIALRCYCSDFHRQSKRLLADNRYRAARSYKNLRTDVTHGSPAPEWTEGIKLLTFKEHPDLRAVWCTIDESFRDQWGYVPQDEKTGLQQWQRGFINNDQFDPSLWFMLMEGEEVVAAALCSQDEGGEPDTGYVTMLGVKKLWRRKSLALNLLYHIFDDFHARGKKYVRLTADSTGMSSLYDRAGLVPILTWVLYEKQLRGGIEPAAAPAAKSSLRPAGAAGIAQAVKMDPVLNAVPTPATGRKNMEVEYIETGIKELDTIKPLWEKLNEYHRRLTKHFAAEIAQHIFEERKKAFESPLKKQHHISLARDKATDIVIGYCVSSISIEEHGEIESIYVEPDYRKKGVGDALMRRALHWLDKKKVKRKVLSVAAGNEDVIGFYNGYGFYPRTTILQQIEQGKETII